ncbi:hypothetical protein SDC9_208293 [bioreactor metagenome]|uniref:Uncharacterized protein n=1 Tax=bioreactor metagenome TaxID=1076179 RepID=A0A645JJP9_9ZZZZ
MEYLCTPAQAFLKGRRADRHNHKFLNIDVVRRVRAAVQYIHHWNRQSVGIYTADKAVKRQTERVCTGPCRRKRDG